MSLYPFSVSVMVAPERASCHLGITQSAYCFGTLLDEALIVALLPFKSAGVVHPTSITTATAAIKIRMSFPLWFGGTISSRWAYGE